MVKIVVIGGLTADPDLRSTPSGKSVCQFTVASNRRWKNADGDKVTDYYRINTWSGLADTCAKYLARGKKVAVVGEFQPRTYEGKDGKPHISLDVQADEVEFLSPREDTQKDTVSETPAPADPNTFTDISSDDIPF